MNRGALSARNTAYLIEFNDLTVCHLAISPHPQQNRSNQLQQRRYSLIPVGGTQHPQRARRPSGQSHRPRIVIHAQSGAGLNRSCDTATRFSTKCGKSRPLSTRSNHPFATARQRKWDTGLNNDRFTYPAQHRNGRIAPVTEILLAIGEIPLREGRGAPRPAWPPCTPEIFGVTRDHPPMCSAWVSRAHEEIVTQGYPLLFPGESITLPYHGSAAIGYIPIGTSVVGITNRPLVGDLSPATAATVAPDLAIADALMEHLHPHGVAGHPRPSTFA